MDLALFINMKLIVGLGNPGEKYIHTRHNLGFDVVDKFFASKESIKLTTWDEKPKLKSQIAQVTYALKDSEEIKIILAKPTTYMNLSGMAVLQLSLFYKISPEDILIVNDELDLPLGSMKIRFGGAAAGHHGVESIIEALGTDKFWRMRLGIGSSKNHDEVAKQKMRNVEEYVVGKFRHDEVGKVKELVKKSVKALNVLLEEGPERAMNQFNTK